MVDVQKSLQAALIPAAALTVVGVGARLLNLIPFLGCLIGLPVFLLQLGLLTWTGFRATKESGLDLPGAAIAGAIAGAVSVLISEIVSFGLNLLGVTVAGAGAESAIITGVVGVLGIVIMPIIGASVGAIFGAIGSLVAGMKK